MPDELRVARSLIALTSAPTVTVFPPNDVNVGEGAAEPGGFDPGQYLSGAGSTSGVAGPGGGGSGDAGGVDVNVGEGAAEPDGFDPGQYLSGAGSTSGVAARPSREEPLHPDASKSSPQNSSGKPGGPGGAGGKQSSRWESRERKVDPETARRMMREFGKLSGG